jgi:DNA (cytosine-5)-methyltransferase 1
MGGSPQVRDRVFIFGKYVGKTKAWNLADEPFSIPYAPVSGWDIRAWDLESHLLFDEAQIRGQESKLSPGREQALDFWEELIQRISPVSDSRRLPGFPLWEFAWVDDPVFDEDTPDWKVDFLLKNSSFYKAHRVEIEKWRARHPEIQSIQNSYRKLEWQAGLNDSIWKGAIQFRPSGIRVKRADYLPALVAMNQTSFIGPRRRDIVVAEAARLQGFPDNFDFAGQPSNQSFKQLGNAVSVGAVKYVFSEFLKLAG